VPAPTCSVHLLAEEPEIAVTHLVRHLDQQRADRVGSTSAPNPAPATPSNQTPPPACEITTLLPESLAKSTNEVLVGVTDDVLLPDVRRPGPAPPPRNPAAGMGLLFRSLVCPKFASELNQYSENALQFRLVRVFSCQRRVDQLADVRLSLLIDCEIAALRHYEALTRCAASPARRPP
jgi:hypothetical protein